MKVLKSILTFLRAWLDYSELCELCQKNRHTHVEICTEAGIRVCGECEIGRCPISPI